MNKLINFSGREVVKICELAQAAYMYQTLNGDITGTNGTSVLHSRRDCANV